MPSRPALSPPASEPPSSNGNPLAAPANNGSGCGQPASQRSTSNGVFLAFLGLTAAAFVNGRRRRLRPAQATSTWTEADVVPPDLG